MQPAKRLLIWSHEFSHELRDALAQLGFEVVALAQGALAGTLSLSLFELYYGSKRIQALGASESRYGALSSEQVRDYSRCVGRLGFVPFNQDYYSYLGGMLALADMEDWAQRHAQIARDVLLGLRIDEVWFFCVPHLGLDNQMALAANQLGCKVLVLRQLPFIAKFDFEAYVGERKQPAAALAFAPWTSGAAPPDLFYMAPPVVRSLWRSWPERACFAVRRALRPGGWRAVIRRLFLGAVERDWWLLVSWLEWCDRRLRPVAGVRQEQRRQWRIGAASRRIVQLDSVSEPFVYFGLHYEPEANTDVYGGSYANQPDALEAILASLPGGWRVLVKENPRQRYLRRSEAFYQRLLRDPRLSFVPDATPAATLLDRCAVAASLAGTLGYESIQRGRASVYFGDPWYAGLPGAVRFVSGLDWQAVSQQRVPPAELDAALNQRLSGAADGVVVPRYDALLTHSQGWRSEAQRTALSLVSISRAVEKPEDPQ